MAKRTRRIKSILISFGASMRDDFIFDVEGSVTKAQLKAAVLGAVHNKLRKMPGVKDITLCT